MATVVNVSGYPLVLDSGVILPKHGDEGHRREGIELSDRDRTRHVAHGRIIVLEDAPSSPSSGGDDGSQKDSPGRKSRKDDAGQG